MKRLLASLRSALGRITSRATPRPPLDFSDPHANPCPTCGGYPGQCGQCGSPARPPDPYAKIAAQAIRAREIAAEAIRAREKSGVHPYAAMDGSRLARHINEARHGNIVGNYAEIERRIAAHALDSQDPFAAIVHEAQDRAAQAISVHTYAATDGSRLELHVNEARRGELAAFLAERERVYNMTLHEPDSDHDRPDDGSAPLPHEREPQSIDEMYTAAAARFLKSPPLRQQAVLRAYEQALQRSLARRMLARSRFLRYLGRRTQEPPP